MKIGDLPVVILAAGSGKRLKPLTYTTPKPMLPIMGRPIMEYVLSSVREAGFSNIIIVINPRHKQVKSYFRDGSKFSLNICYVFQDKPLGMAHAVRLVRDTVGEDVFLLMASDNIIEAGKLLAIVEKHFQGDFSGTLSLMKAPMKAVTNSSTVIIDEHLRVTNIIEKPSPVKVQGNIVSLPIYVFNRSIFRFLPKVDLSPRGEYELQDAIQMMIDDGLKISGFFINNRLHLTTIVDLININLYFLEREKSKLS